MKSNKWNSCVFMPLCPPCAVVDLAVPTNEKLQPPLPALDFPHSTNTVPQKICPALRAEIYKHTNNTCKPTQPNTTAHTPTIHMQHACTHPERPLSKSLFDFICPHGWTLFYFQGMAMQKTLKNKGVWWRFTIFWEGRRKVFRTCSKPLFFHVFWHVSRPIEGTKNPQMAEP